MLGTHKPRLHKVGYYWFCEGQNVIGWGDTWREAYAAWRRYLLPQLVHVSPARITTQLSDPKPGTVICFDVPRNQLWKRVVDRFVDFFGERA